MGSKLGPHVLRVCSGLSGQLEANPRIVKLAGDWGLAEQIDREKVFIIGRKHQEGYDAQLQRASGKTPATAARQFVGDQMATYKANPSIVHWEGHNEPVWNDPADMAWYAQFEIERMRLMADAGLKCVLGNFATGNPDMALWEHFLPALAQARDYEAILGLHEYSCPWVWWMTGTYQIDPNENQGDEGWTTLRYRKVYRQHLIPNGLGSVPLAITEFGIDPMVNPKPPGAPGGAWRSSKLQAFWREHDGEDDPAEFYARQLIWYDNELKRDDHVIGATVFTWGSYSSTPWQDFDVGGTRVAELLTEYVRNYPPEPFTYPADESPPPHAGRGTPRIQYERTVLLFHVTESHDLVGAAIDATWGEGRPHTVSQSADDAGIGDLDVRRVIAVNPDRWPGDLRAFFDAHYPDVELEEIIATTPAELRMALGGRAVPWDRDVSATLPQRSDCTGILTNGWWQRTREQIDGITIHHTLSGSPDATARYYVWQKTWTDDDGNVHVGHPTIPYHIWITETGDVLLCAPLTNGLWHDHTGHENTHVSIGLAGNLLQNMPSDAQLKAAIAVCSWFIKSNEYPGIGSVADVSGHMDYYPTDCPGWVNRETGMDRWEATFYRMLGQPIQDEELLLGINDWPPGVRDGSGAYWMARQGFKRGLIYVPLYVIEVVDDAGYKSKTHWFDYSSLLAAVPGARVVLNLRWSWSTDKGGRGTLPPQRVADQDAFIGACAKIISDARGVWGFSIANEWNNPREWPEGWMTVDYVADMYRKIFTKCPDANLTIGAPDPFFGPDSDCATWYRKVLEAIGRDRIRWLDLHGYVRGPNPDLCWSTAKFGSDPLKWQGLNYWDCCEQLLARVPSSFHNLPVIVSEFNHLWRMSEESADIGWVGDERAADVVQAAVQRAKEWNASGTQNPVIGLALYRWSGDEWTIERNSWVRAALGEHCA